MPLDVASIERATFRAVPPQRLVTLDDWLVGLDDGTVGRVHSAVPIRHDAQVERELDAVLQAFAQAGRAPVFRIPRLTAFDAMRPRLAGHGLHGGKPTLTMTGPIAGLAGLPAGAAVDMAETPGEDWSAVFLGEGFDPVDGASRLAILRRATSSLFAGVRIDGVLAAVGSACFAQGWCSVHGMRTLPAFRARGCARSILSAFGREARDRGVERAFLQVEQGNEKAQALYRRAGLGDAWVYEYWKR
jgi:ribosomal protein S18 acetylase RimI-like enzyme